MKNSAGRGGCYPLRPKAEVDNILRDLQNSSYSTKAEFNNYCFIIHSKYFLARFPHRSLLHYAYTPLFQENNSDNNRRPLGLWCFVLSF